jgi:signal transduction histidine kinase
VNVNIPDLERLCIDGDEHKLAQVIRNLLSNALKFTPQGGEVFLKALSLNTFSELSVEYGALPQQVSEPLNEHLMWLTLTVTDTGLGISQVCLLSKRLYADDNVCVVIIPLPIEPGESGQAVQGCGTV